jgi:hypothetical protein
MGSINKPQLVWDERTGMYKFNAPKGHFNKGFIDFLKMIPINQRHYIKVEDSFGNPAHTWWFYEKFFPAVKVAFEKSFPYGFVFEKAKVDSFNNNNSFVPSAPTVEQDLAVLVSLTGHKMDELKNAKLQDATTIYRRAARKYHPDINPQGATDMARLNESWARLKEVYYKDRI